MTATAKHEPSAVDDLVAALAPVPCITERAAVKLKSRDFYWYSPILKEELRSVTADLIACPRSEAEVIHVTRTCFARGVPLTVRGAGTGNYGQAMPLRGGVVMEMMALDKIKWIKPGAMRVEAGKKLIDLEAETLPQGWEMRFHPSTRRTASIGGFIAGGSSGIGSINFGVLRTRGNVHGLRVITCEKEPQAIELRGDDVQQAIHAYGTNGIITEVEIPLAPAWAWYDCVVAFPDFMQAMRFGQALAESDAIVRKVITPIDWGAAKYFRPLRASIPENHAIVITMIAEASMEPFRGLVAQHGGKLTFERAPGGTTDEIPPLYEFTWNHTTLQALKVDRTVTYLQTLFPAPTHMERVEHMWKHFGDEVPMHIEFVRLGGQICCFGLQVVRYTTAERLREIIKYHDDNGCPIFNPHTTGLEDGGMKVPDELQVGFKHRADPMGLLNPGKMRGWTGVEPRGWRA